MSAAHPDPTFIVSPAPPSSAARTAGVVMAGLVLGATVFALFIAGITFFALAIALPIAIPLAEQFALPVRPVDLAIAERLADAWWVFGVLAVASVSAALVVAVKAISILSPVPRD